MPTAWRLVNKKHSDSAFTGQGAADDGGRWNSPGIPVVYTSWSMSLAALEVLVHLPRPALLKYVAFHIEINAHHIQKLPIANLPKNWRSEPPGLQTMIVGDTWIKEAQYPVLEVPCVIIPHESNFLLNPVHPDFKKLVRSNPNAFSFDPQFLI